MSVYPDGYGERKKRGRALRASLLIGLVAGVIISTLFLVPTAYPSTAWTAGGAQVSSFSEDDTLPQIASDGAGGAFITWKLLCSDNIRTMIFVGRMSTAGTMLGTGQAGWDYSSSTMNQLNPQIASDGAGGAIITWEDNRNGNWDIYAQRVNQNGLKLWGDLGVQVSTSTRDDVSPQVTTDGAGGAIITWKFLNSGSSNVIYAGRVSAAGTLSWSFAANTCYTSIQQNPQIVSDGANGAIITWEDNRNGDWDIYASRVNLSGYVWASAGAKVSIDTKDDMSPQIVSDGANGAVITWKNIISATEPNIMAARMSAAGTRLWREWPVGEAGIQQNPQIATDGAGGAIITWEDDRNDHYEIYAQWITRDGNLQWESQGVLVSSALTDQTLPQLTTDGAGGAIITWHHMHFGGGGSSVLAARVNAAGSVSWSSTLNSAAAGVYCQNPQITGDGMGNSIVTWEDSRNGNLDIYAQKLTDTRTITASAGTGGSINPSGSVTVNCGASQAFAIGVASGYRTTDVVVDGTTHLGAVSSYTFTGIAANHTIAASFIKTWVITASAAAGGSISPSGAVTVDQGADRTFNITGTTGYHVADVVVDGTTHLGAVSSYTFTGVTAAHTIAASFAVDTHTITASAGTGGTIDPSGAVSVNDGSSQAFTIAATTGYRIADVVVDGTTHLGVVTSYTFTNVTTNHTIAASFIKTWDITASAGTGGSISPSGTVTVDEGADQTFTIEAAAGYRIFNVVIDGTTSLWAVSSYTFSDIAEYHIIRAFFSPDPVITASAGTGGTISPSGAVTVDYGSDQAFTINAATGYDIADVVVDGTTHLGAVPSHTFTGVTSNHTIAASFIVETHTINASAGTGGSISPSGTVTVNYGSDQAFTIAPEENYHVAGVLVDGSGMGAVVNGYTFPGVTADHTIAATFALNQYPIAATAAPPAGGAITGASIWTGTGGVVSSNSILSLAWDGSGLYAGTTGQGVWRYDPEDKEWTDTGGGVGTFTILSLASDGTGLYAGTDGQGVWRYNPVSFEWTNTGGGVSSYSIRSLASDGTGLYAGSDGYGVWRYDPHGPKWINTLGEFDKSVIGSLAWDGTGLYAGTNDNGVWRYDPEDKEWTSTSGDVDKSAILSLAWDGTGLYVGTNDNGVWRYDPEDKEWTSTSGDVEAYGIPSLAWDGSGLYAGSDGHGVWRYDTVTFTWTDTGGDVGGYIIRSLTSDGTGLYAGTDGHGVWRYNTYTFGQTVDLTASPDTANGYHFANWTEGGLEVSTSAAYSFIAESTHTLVAHFALDQYTIAASANLTAGGTITGAGTYNHGSTVNLSASHAAGYHFVKWTEGGLEVSTSAAYSFIAESTHTLVAHFALDQYTIAASANLTAGGTITGAGTYNHGSTVNLSASHAAGYHFVKWTEGGLEVSTSAAYSFIAESARTLVAHFALNTFAVNASVSGGNGTVTEPTQTVNYGSSATIHINPETGYKIASITDSGAAATIANPYVISNVTAVHTVVVTFAQDVSPSAVWYLAEGSTNYGFDCYITIENPNTSAVTADVTYMTGSGPVTAPSVNLPPKSQATINPRDVLGNKDFSTKVSCKEGKTIAVDRTMSWTGPGAASSEAHSSIGVTSPSKTWYLPEGSSKWGFECYLLIQNPNASAARLHHHLHDRGRGT